jgi:hypothetical protein
MNSPILGRPAAIRFLLHCHCSNTPYEPDSEVARESAEKLKGWGAIETWDEYCAVGEPPVYRTTPLGAAWVHSLCTNPIPRAAFVDAHGDLIKLP